ncbi:MAG: ABC transporter substrate-binding protein, partial [Elainellaceae cyanobacterium]
AVSTLESYLQQNRNDPEALIYLNNARIGQADAYVLMVSVPAQTDPNPAQEILRGVAQVQQEINQQGGINGTPLKIGIASDDNDPAMAEKVAQALVDTPSVLGVIGHFGSETTLAASAVYEQGQLPVVSPTSTSVQISEVGEYVFRTVPSDRFTASTLSRHLINDLNAQQVAVYYNAESDYSQSLKNEFTTALYSDGGQVALEVNAAEAGFDAAGSVAQAQQQGAEAIALLTNTATLDQAMQVIQANSGQLQLVGGDSLYNPKLLEMAGSAAAGMDIAVPWILLSNPQSTYAQSSRQLWGGDVNWRTAMAYDATLALAEAMKQDPSRTGIQNALSQSGFQVDGATGTVQFLPSGDRNQAMQLVTVASGGRSGYGYDFVPAD